MQTYELSTSVDTINAVNPFQFASLLDADGREIPITEEMIMRACDELMECWHFPKKAA